MTKIQNPIIGRASGQAGGMIFSKSFDKNVMRSRPMTVANPNTPAQQRQREFFAELTAISKTVTPDTLIDLFPAKPATRSRYSELQKQLAVGRDVSGATGTIDFDEVNKIGNGITCLTGSGVTVTDDAGEMSVSFDSLSVQAPAVGTDPVDVLFINQSRSESHFAINVGNFEDGGGNIPYPSGWDPTDDIFAFVAIRPAAYKAGAELSGAIK
jgi:hypothetical protein